MKNIILLISALLVGLLCAQETVTEQPKPVYKQTPQYPENARKLRIEAQVNLNALIGKEGNVLETELLQAIIVYPGKNFNIESPADLNTIPVTHRNPAAKLVELAQQAALQWKFTPAKAGVKPVETVILIPFTFHLNSEIKPKSGLQKK